MLTTLRAKLRLLMRFGSIVRHNPRRQVAQVLARERPIKLHLGCGSDYLPGYVNLDVNPNVRADLHMRVEDLCFFPPDIVDAMESYHFFEHLSPQDARAALKEWFRILKPGGVVVLELPNLEVCIREMGKHFDQNGIDLAMVGIYGYAPDIVEGGVWQMHKWGWTPETLRSELEAVGFSHVARHPIRQTWRPAAQFNRDMQIRAIKSSGPRRVEYLVERVPHGIQR